MVVELLGKEDTKSVLANRDDMNRIVKEILDEALGLGPLEDMLADKTISEIMVVGPKRFTTSKVVRLRSLLLHSPMTVRL